MMKQNNATQSLAHTKWNCKYHIVFAPKYRRKVFYESKRLEIRDILRTLCQWKGVEILEGEICRNHIDKLDDDYYKFEPIKWRIVSVGEDNYTLLSEYIISANQFYDGSLSRIYAKDYQGNKIFYA